MNFRSTITAAIILLIPILLSAQKQIKEKKLKKDFNQLITNIEAHPDPYRNLAKEDFYKMVDSLKAKITDMDVISFYKLCAPILHEIGDGHTGLYLPEKIIKKHMKDNGAFPYDVYISDDNRMFIIKNYGEDETIPLGSEIKSINGLPILSFLDAIDPYTFYERLPFRNFTIENSIQDYFYLQFGNFTELDLVYFSDKEHRQTVSNIPYKLYAKSKKTHVDKIESLVKKGKPYEYEKLKDGVGLLKIHSFLIFNENKFDGFLRRTFKQINKDEIHSLILDVRGNLGGYPRAAKDLCHYITDLPFKLMAITNMKISTPYRNSIRSLYPHINFNELTFNRRGYDIDLYTLFNGKLGELTTEVNQNNEVAITQQNEFDGELYLLIDRKSFSAASSFAASFRCYGLGIIVGEPTGGTKTFFGNSIDLSLYHSNLVIKIGTAKNYTTCFTQDQNEPISPDVQVSPSVLDRVNDSDQILFYTMRLINKKRKVALEEKK